MACTMDDMRELSYSHPICLGRCFVFQEVGLRCVQYTAMMGSRLASNCPERRPSSWVDRCGSHLTMECGTLGVPQP